MQSKVKTVTANKPKYRTNRAHDYLYDPVHVVSGTKDFQKCAMEAVRTSAEFKICPVFPTMFTDLPTCPRNVLAIKSFDKVPGHMDRTWAGRQRTKAAIPDKLVDVDGVDRHMFCRRPMVPFLHPILPPVRLLKDVTESEKEPKGVGKPRTFGTQTDYRESETQTVPWSPPYDQTGTANLEILSLAHLSWENGLPAGMHEVEIIERARIKRAWEGSMPPMTDPESIEKRRKVIEMMERDEWAFREKEIDHINELRLKLSRVLWKENTAHLSEKLCVRLNSFWARRKRQRDQKVASIKHKANRELRKLRLKHEGVNKKYHKVNVVDEHDDRKSDWFGPQLRFGDHPKRAHEVINCRIRFLSNMKGLDVLEKMPRFLPPLDRIRTSAPRREWELCIRETRWTEEVLKKLHEDLKCVRMKRYDSKATLHLMTRIPMPVTPPTTPSIEGVPDWEEDVYQSSVFLQKVVKGRAIQTMMFRGRERCRELIEELKSTHALHEAGLQVRREERFHVMSQQRARLLEKRREDRLSELLSSLEGLTLGATLDFLCKELWRLQDERRAHAFALLAESQRHRREAAEAGRRQREERRRREHDEMFKQVVKVHQDTVDVYLEDLILESMSWVAEDEARAYVQELAKRVDQAAQDAYDRRDCLEREELVADLIHNFVLPEAEKQRVREKMRVRQEKYLHAAHQAIYEDIDSLHLTDPPPEGKTSQEEQKGEDKEELVAAESSAEALTTAITADISTMLYQLLEDNVRDESDDALPTLPLDTAGTSISISVNERSSEGDNDPIVSLFSNFKQFGTTSADALSTVEDKQDALSTAEDKQDALSTVGDKQDSSTGLTVEMQPSSDSNESHVSISSFQGESEVEENEFE